MFKEVGPLIYRPILLFVVNQAQMENELATVAFITENYPANWTYKNGNSKSRPSQEMVKFALEKLATDGNLVKVTTGGRTGYRISKPYLFDGGDEQEWAKSTRLSALTSGLEDQEVIEKKILNLFSLSYFKAGDDVENTMTLHFFGTLKNERYKETIAQALAALVAKGQLVLCKSAGKTYYEKPNV